jgi:lipoprotein-anchoring transpeptidase ErfK/SrfK
MRLTRRHLLKAGGAVLATLPALGLPHFVRAQDPAPVDLKSLKIEPTHRPLGRAIISNLIVREAPATSAKEVRKLKLNEVISITGEVSTAGPKAHNPIWYKTKDGWVHSGNVQPADDKPNKPLSQLQGESMWGEVTVPVSTLRSQTDEAAPARRNLFFGMVFRITQIAQDDAGKAWYRVADGNTGNIGFADARHLRVLTEDDFAPISPNVPLDKKRIEVDLKKQIATAYEDDKPVFTARVATGGRYRTPEGVRSFHTIPGDHRIFRKIAGQLMAGGTSGYDGYYLPGIGWVSYFTSSGIAFHSTYWHNDYGAPRSHGCVNMLPEDSHWVFRWTMPVFSATVQQMQINPRAEGSHVKVF